MPAINKKPRYIRASEIGAYIYCRRAWWLRQIAGFEPEGKTGQFAQGETAHLKHGQLVRRTQHQRRAALFLLAGGLLLLFITIGLMLTLH